jgi:hypothetical protein
MSVADNLSDKFQGQTITTQGDGLSTALGAASGLAIAAYVVAVIYQGNLDNLGSMLLKEEGYLEFVIAIVLLWMLHRYGPDSPITDAITGIGILVVILRLASTANLTSALSSFASGQAGLMQTVQALFGHPATVPA